MVNDLCENVSNICIKCPPYESESYGPLRVVSFHLQRRTFENNGRQCIELRAVAYIMRRTRLPLTSRTSQFLHYVFKQLYDVSVQEKRTQTRPYVQLVEMWELSCFLQLLSALFIDRHIYARMGARRRGQGDTYPPPWKMPNGLIRFSYHVLVGTKRTKM